VRTARLTEAELDAYTDIRTLYQGARLAEDSLHPISSIFQYRRKAHLEITGSDLVVQTQDLEPRADAGEPCTGIVVHAGASMPTGALTGRACCAAVRPRTRIRIMYPCVARRARSRPLSIS
jgi:hypothetical protein